MQGNIFLSSFFFLHIELQSERISVHVDFRASIAFSKVKTCVFSCASSTRNMALLCDAAQIRVASI